MIKSSSYKKFFQGHLLNPKPPLQRLCYYGNESGKHWVTLSPKSPGGFGNTTFQVCLSNISIIQESVCGSLDMLYSKLTHADKPKKQWRWFYLKPTIFLKYCLTTQRLTQGNSLNLSELVISFLNKMK